MSVIEIEKRIATMSCNINEGIFSLLNNTQSLRDLKGVSHPKLSYENGR